MTGTAITGLAFSAAAMVWAAAWVYGKVLWHRMQMRKLDEIRELAKAKKVEESLKRRLIEVEAEKVRVDGLEVASGNAHERITKLELQVRDVVNTLQMRKLK